MPFYEYQCDNCGHTLEAMQKITDPPLKKCPHCGKPQLQKAHVGARIPVEGRRLVRDGFQIATRTTSATSRIGRRRSPQGRQEGDDRGVRSARRLRPPPMPLEAREERRQVVGQSRGIPGKSQPPRRLRPRAGAAAATSRRRPAQARISPMPGRSSNARLGLR